jgi:FlaA1/EpsC-like NDP-sugar epimerase
MGEPVKIVSLVENFARLLSIPDIDFRFTGLRPGEKLNEELFADGEERVATAHSRITMALPPLHRPGFRAGLRDLYDAAEHNRPEEVVEHLARLIPGYKTPDGPRTPVLAAASLYPDDY